VWIVNGNNPIQWEANKLWQDNLGALFTHAGHSETIYSTTTVGVSTAGTTTIDYWAVIHIFVDGIATDPVAIYTTTPGSHIIEYVVSDSSGLTSTSTRTVIVTAPANDNVATSTRAANDNAPLPELQATGTGSTTTAQ
jgi:hypothetical protein